MLTRLEASTPSPPSEKCALETLTAALNADSTDQAAKINQSDKLGSFSSAVTMKRMGLTLFAGQNTKNDLEHVPSEDLWDSGENGIVGPPLSSPSSGRIVSPIVTRPSSRDSAENFKTKTFTCFEHI